MSSKTYGYARVSSKEQHLDRQLDALVKFGVPERDIITDKASGKDFDRPGYIALKTRILREGDTLVIKDLDRLGRNKQQIKEELEFYKQTGIRVKILKLPTTLADFGENGWVLDMVNNILIEVLGTIAEQERLTIKTRQAEGIAAAKKQGKHLGRPKTSLPDNWNDVYNDWSNGKITATDAVNKLGISRSTFYRLIKNNV
ncbi:MAG: recombinase family protein [Acutalibacteraceae bacterium]|nr:recombinase family protein [Acutalibacteraceae bacterium]